MKTTTLVVPLCGHCTYAPCDAPVRRRPGQGQVVHTGKALVDSAPARAAPGCRHAGKAAGAQWCACPAHWHNPACECFALSARLRRNRLQWQLPSHQLRTMHQVSTAGSGGPVVQNVPRKYSLPWAKLPLLACLHPKRLAACSTDLADRLKRLWSDFRHKQQLTSNMMFQAFKRMNSA